MIPITENPDTAVSQPTHSRDGNLDAALQRLHGVVG
jgi:hypothetical protein